MRISVRGGGTAVRRAQAGSIRAARVELTRHPGEQLRLLEAAVRLPEEQIRVQAAEIQEVLKREETPHLAVPRRRVALRQSAFQKRKLES